MEIELVKKNEHSYKIRNSFNGKHLGEVIMDVDGSYYYWPDKNLSGSWSSHNLKQIAKILDDLNSEYEERVKKYFKDNNL